jgi:hypothetical protein
MVSIFSRLLEYVTEQPVRFPTGEPARLIEPWNWLMRLKVRLVSLDDEGLSAHGELIAGTRARDLARPYLECRGLGIDARLAEADNGVRAPGDDAHRDRLATGGRVDGIDTKRGEGRVHRALERCHQVRLPLINTRGRVQIGKGFDCTCSMTQRANCWSSACLA